MSTAAELASTFQCSQAYVQSPAPSPLLLVEKCSITGGDLHALLVVKGVGLLALLLGAGLGAVAADLDQRAALEPAAGATAGPGEAEGAGVGRAKGQRIAGAVAVGVGLATAVVLFVW